MVSKEKVLQTPVAEPKQEKPQQQKKLNWVEPFRVSEAGILKLELCMDYKIH